jgi:serine protease Do
MKAKILTVFSKSVAATALIAAVMAAGYGLGSYTHHDVTALSPITAAQAAPGNAAPVSATPSPVASVTLPDFTSIVAKQGPAVVNISVDAKIKEPDFGFSPFPQMDPNDPFYQFFRHFQMPEPRGGDAHEHVLGSGFIISPDGIILTNAHVVANADEVTVKLTDKREFKAKVKGVDKVTDVAVLKINAKNLPTVNIGDSNQARVGQWVVAIGSPFGFDNSVTAGIISAKSRSLPDANYVPFLQTDVAVNPGNSGGPLFNTNGQVIGINSQIYTNSGGYQGLSFAIPIDVAMNVERQLLKNGKVNRGHLGVTIQEVNQDLADTFGLDKPEGALVSSVEKGSPADKAGIKSGDIILKFDGKDIENSSDLPLLVANVAPGEKATLELWHKGKIKDITMAVGKMTTVVAKNDSGGQSGEDKLGLEVRPLTRDERKQDDVSNGLEVEMVNGDSPASRAGIQPGDIILAVNGENVSSARKLHALVVRHHKHVALLIQRGDQRLFVPLSLG